MSKRLALLIGNVRYQDDRLAAPVSGKDLTALADVLRDPKLGQFDDVFVQVNNTAVEVQLAIAEFFAESHSPHDTLLIYYAGQILHHQGQPYLAQWDTYTEENVQATIMQPEYLRRRLSMASARYKVFVLDCYFSKMLADGPELPEDDAWLIDAFSGNDLVTLMAARATAVGEEPAMASPFTPALIDGLKKGGATGNEDGVVTANAWFDYAYSQSESSERHCSLTNETAAEKIIISAATENTLMAVPLSGTAAAGGAGRKKWLVPALILLLIFIFIGGGLYAGGFIGQSAGVEPTSAGSEAAAAADQVTETPTSTATQTAEPTDTATATETAVPTKPGVKETATTTSTPSITATDALTATAEITATAPITTTGTPLPVGVSVVRGRIFMRSGPAINFRIAAYLDQGTAVTVLGRTPSGDWLNVELADGRTGWVSSEMVESPADEALEDIPEVATIPAAVNEFYDFSAGDTEDGLTVAVSHVYIGSVGADAFFRAELLPQTDLVAIDYVNSRELGLGQFIINFSKTGEGAYTSTAVRVCMVSASGDEFFCDTFPARKEW